MRVTHTLSIPALVLACGLMGLAGCQSSQSTATAEAPKSKPAPKPVKVAQPGMVSTAIALPTGDKRTSGLYVEKMAPAEVSLNQEYTYTIRVTNLASTSLSNVKVVDQLPSDGFTVTSTEPAARQADGNLHFDLGTMKPGQVLILVVKGKATKVGELTNCVTGSYDLVGCLTVAVTQPDLKMTKTLPQQVLICDDIPFTATVSNNGTGVARNVKFVDNLPDGLVVKDGGKSSLSLDLGDLMPGKSKTVTTTLKAKRTGTFKNTANASAAGGLKATASDSVKVLQPVLAITKTGTKTTYAGRNIDYTITVKNTGDGVAKNLMVNDGVPAGTTYVASNMNGAYANGSVTWKLGDLQPGQTKTVKMTVKANKIMTVHNAAAADADCAKAVTAKATTEVKGIPAILLEVVDVEDPIEVGSNVTYVITATNQGSATGTGIKINAMLEKAQQYVSSTGATKGTHAGGKVTFTPLAKLAPGAKASWKVTVKAAEAGDIRFTVTMNTDQLTREVRETEATNFYK